MKLTEKQINDFTKAKEQLLEKIEVYEQGIDFAENWCGNETGKREWIKHLKVTVNDTNFVVNKGLYTNIEFAVATERYLKNIEISIMKEFTGLFKPFDELIPKYHKEVQKILLKIEL